MPQAGDKSYTYKLPDYVVSRPRTRIVCTVGPATESVELICGLIRAGMSVARLNLSHGDVESHERYVQNVRRAAQIMKAPIGILADLPGPKYRTGDNGEDYIRLEDGQEFVLTAARAPSTSSRAAVWPVGLHRDVSAGSQILVDEGVIEMEVALVEGENVHCRVLSGGALQSRKAVTAPGNTSTLDYFTDETASALDFAVASGVEFIGLSYVRNREDVRGVRERVSEKAKEVQSVEPQLIAKIEVTEAVKNLDSILDETQGVMVARGDLGVELPIEEVPGIQRRMVRAANDAGKVVIIATQMLESMKDAPHPTRAEASDVYNAVLDGADAIMLSAETSIGKYPVQTVDFMAKIARRAENEMDFEELLTRRQRALQERGHDVDAAIAYSAVQTASTMGAKVILAFTESGSTADRVASFRPSAPLIAMARDSDAGPRLALRWGVISLNAPEFMRVQQMFVEGSKAAIESGFASEGELAVAVAGMPVGVPGNTNMLRVIHLPEPISHLAAW